MVTMVTMVLALRERMAGYDNYIDMAANMVTIVTIVTIN